MVEGLEAAKLTVGNLSLTLGAQWTRLFALFLSTVVVVGCMFTNGRSDSEVANWRTSDRCRGRFAN